MVLAAGEAELDFPTRIEGLAGDGDLRANFLLTHTGEEARFDLPFAVASVPVAPGDAFGKQAFSAWVARGDATAGFGLVSRACTRFGVAGTLFALSLGEGADGARAETAPGVREYSYGLVAHAGAGLDGVAACAAAERVHPLVVRPATAHEGARPPRHSFLRLARVEAGRALEGAQAGIELSAFKPADDGDGWIVRLRETRGEACAARITFDRSLFSAERTDLLEKGIGALALVPASKQVEVALGPYRVETVRVRTRPARAARAQ